MFVHPPLVTAAAETPPIYALPLLFVNAIFIFCQAIPGIIMYVITPELYTTKYRAVGLGSASVVTRLGGGSSGGGTV